MISDYVALYYHSGNCRVYIGLELEILEQP